VGLKGYPLYTWVASLPFHYHIYKGTTKCMYFYYGPNSIEIVETYKYLGILFHYSGKFSQAMSNLPTKQEKHILR
jgi:hypothetical protein